MTLRARQEEKVLQAWSLGQEPSWIDHRSRLVKELMKHLSLETDGRYNRSCLKRAHLSIHQIGHLFIRRMHQ